MTAFRPHPAKSSAPSSARPGARPQGTALAFSVALAIALAACGQQGSTPAQGAAAQGAGGQGGQGGQAAQGGQSAQGGQGAQQGGGQGAKPAGAAAQGGAPGGAPGGGMPPPVVSVQTVEPRSVTLSRELPGRTSAYLIAEVRPQVNGIMKERLFEEGAMVKAGQALYRVESAPYRAAVDSAQAALQKAQANVAANRTKAERLRKLAEINAVSRQSSDDAAAALQTGVADVAAAKAALETAKINLAYTTITAPIAGRVGTSTYTVGALLTAGQVNALTSVQQLDPIYVDITQSSTELLQLQRDLASGAIKSAESGSAAVKLLLPDGTAYDQEGKLTFSGATVDPSTGSVTMRAVFPNPKHVLLPGMFTRATLQEGVKPNVILIAQRAAMREPTGGARVMVVNAENKVEARSVVIDRAIGDQYLISQGLNAGERVIVDGLQKVKPGAPVNAMPAGAAPGGAAPQQGGSNSQQGGAQAR